MKKESEPELGARFAGAGGPGGSAPACPGGGPAG